MKSCDPDLKLTLSLWWAYMWRIHAVIIPVSIVIGPIIAIIYQFLGLEHLVDLNAIAIGVLITIFFSIFCLYHLLNKGFGFKKKYRILIVEQE